MLRLYGFDDSIPASTLMDNRIVLFNAVFFVDRGNVVDFQLKNSFSEINTIINESTENDNVQKYLIMSLGCILLMAVSFLYGRHIEAQAVAAELVETYENVIKEANEQAKADFDLVLKAEQQKAERKLQEAKRNVKIVKEIQTNEIYINPDCNLPDGGMRLWNDEASGKEDAPSKPDGEVSGRITKEN